MRSLSLPGLADLPADLQTPLYPLPPGAGGIVHVGMGHFHRAHMALYLDDLKQQGRDLDWAIRGLGVRSHDHQLHAALGAQDHLYTLTEKASDGDWRNRVIGSVRSHLVAPDNPERAVALLADPSTRIVSLTITEGGYGIDDTDGSFAADSPELAHDLHDPSPNRTIHGLLLQAMQRRRAAGAGGLTVMSCDNVEENGRVARAAFIGFAEAVDPQTASWMESELAFPSSMVDRVTPGTVEEDRRYLERKFGYHDRWPVTCEPFRQWVLEDNFVAGRPGFEHAGVELVDDVRPYELMKLRLANGTHQALCYAGALLGLQYVHEAIADTDIHRFLLCYIDREAAPTLTAIPGVDFPSYGRTVIERFGNSAIQDPLSRICAETSDRIPKFLLPVARSHLAEGGPVQVCATAVALWARYATGEDLKGRPIEVVDPRKDAVLAAVRASEGDPSAFLDDRSLFGNLGQSPAFRSAFAAALTTIRTRGVRAALREASAAA